MNRIERLSAAIFVLASGGALFTQPAAAVKKEFEVASVKAVPFSGVPRPINMRGGPGTNDPDRVTFENYSMIGLLQTAFDARFDQISGPDWLRVIAPSVDFYNISATLPPGTSKEDFHFMLRNLLVARFSLAFHIGQKETRAYRLAVGAGKPRLKSSVESVPGSDAPSSNAGLTMGADGYPAIPPGAPSGATIGNRSRRRFMHETMSAFAGVLAQQLGSPVADATGLSGQYDFELFWTARPSDGSDDGPTIDEAVRDQLGLRLESSKASEDVIVIDRIEKAPSAN